MAIKLSLPGWLANLVAWFASFLAGAAAQKAADDAAEQRASDKAQKTVEDASREVGALSDDEVSKELGQWQSKP